MEDPPPSKRRRATERAFEEEMQTKRPRGLQTYSPKVSRGATKRPFEEDASGEDASGEDSAEEMQTTRPSKRPRGPQTCPEVATAWRRADGECELGTNGYNTRVIIRPGLTRLTREWNSKMKFHTFTEEQMKMFPPGYAWKAYVPYWEFSGNRLISRTLLVSGENIYLDKHTYVQTEMPEDPIVQDFICPGEWLV